jgi:hypothetical protein
MAGHGPTGQAGAMNRSLLAALAVSAVSCRSTTPVVHHFDDNYEAARQEAVRNKLPLVVEVWAPW